MSVLWSIFGNSDDWPPPNWYLPDKPMWRRKVWWLIRNPLHNFSFYFIGLADKDFTSYGKDTKNVFLPGGGWNWAVRKYKWLRLPFISYCNRRGFIKKFYIGWRQMGNFGIKLTINFFG